MRNKERVLIVDDHNALRIVMSKFLSKTFKIKTASNGFEAISWLETGNIPDAIVLDVNMPDCGGVDFLTNLRNSGFYQDVPVVLVSGEEDGKVIEKCIEIGINGYLKKPFNPTDLEAKILTILNKNKDTIKIPKTNLLDS